MSGISEINKRWEEQPLDFLEWFLEEWLNRNPTPTPTPPRTPRGTRLHLVAIDEIHNKEDT